MGDGVRRIILLALGWEDLPKSVSVEGAPKQQRLREPVRGCCWNATAAGCCSTPASTRH
jgi:hypothetical protein